MKDARPAVALLAGLALLCAQALLNQVLAPFGLYVHLDGLYFLFPGFYLGLLPAWLVIAFPVLLAEAGRAIPFGLRLQAYTLALAVMVYLRNRLRREKGAHLTWTAAVLTLALHGGLGLRLAMPILDEPLFWIRFLIDAALSIFLTALLAVPWVELQIQLCRQWGTEPAAELPKV